MKHFLDENGALYAIEDDGSQDFLIQPDWKPATDDEIKEVQNPPADAWKIYQFNAKNLLDKSDMTVLRCVENGIPVPADWAIYRKALRAILSAQTGDPSKELPTCPGYPSGS